MRLLTITMTHKITMGEISLVEWSKGLFCFSLFSGGENASLTLNISSLPLEILARREPSQLESPNSPESETVNTR